MKTIYKYVLKDVPAVVGGDIVSEVSLPIDAEILTAEIQHNNVCLWALVDPSKESKERTFIMFGTGMPVPESLELNYIKTILIKEGIFVYHIFEVLNTPPTE